MDNTKDSGKKVEFVINDDSTLTKALSTFIGAWSHFKMEDEGLAKHMHDMLESESSVKYLKEELKKILEAHRVKPYKLYSYIMNRPKFKGSMPGNPEADKKLVKLLVDFYANHESIGKLMANDTENNYQGLLSLLTKPDEFIKELNTIKDEIVPEFAKAIFEAYEGGIDDIVENIQEYCKITGENSIIMDEYVPDECLMPELSYDAYQAFQSLGINIKEEALKQLKERSNVTIDVQHIYAYDNYSRNYLLNSITWTMQSARYNCSMYSSDGKFFIPDEDIYQKLIPGGGMCDTKLGEMLRACQRVIYRFFNDGDTALSVFECNTIDYANLLTMIDEWFTLDQFETIKNAYIKMKGDEEYRKLNRYGLFTESRLMEAETDEQKSDSLRQITRYMYDCGCEGAAVHCAIEMGILLVQCYLDNPEFLNEDNNFDSRVYHS